MTTTTITTTTVTVADAHGATTTTTTTTDGAVVAVVDAGYKGEAIPSTVSFYATHEVSRRPEWEVLRREIVRHAVRLTDHVVCDFRVLLTIGKNLDLAGRLMWQLIKRFEPQVLVGPGFGAAPLLFSTTLAALADGVELTTLMVRDKRKGHNQKKWVEGKRPPKNARAVMLDDFMEKGSAVGLVEEALAGDQIEIDLKAVAVFFDMWEPLGSRQISVGRYSAVALYKRHDVGLSRDCFDAKPPQMKGTYPDFIGKPLWWRFTLNERREYALKCAPVIADDAVFVADDSSRVYRHNARTGDIEWEYESLDTPPKGIPELLTYADGSLVFGCYDGTITRLDGKTGNILWRWRQDSSVHATPEVDLTSGRVYVNTEQYNNGKPFGHLQALDWKTGRMIWSYTHAYWPPGSPVVDATTKTVVACCNDQTIIAVDADTGKLRWKQRTNGLVRGKPAIAGGKALAATETGRLQAFDLKTGEPRWTVRYGKNAFHNFVLAEGDVAYVMDGKWHLTAFDVATGAIRWLSRMRTDGAWCPVRLGQYLVVLSSGGHIAVYDPALELKVWEDKISGHYRQPAAVGFYHDKEGNQRGLFAAASNDSGLKVYEIHPSYTDALPADRTARPGQGGNGVDPLRTPTKESVTAS